MSNKNNQSNKNFSHQADTNNENTFEAEIKEFSEQSNDTSFDETNDYDTPLEDSVEQNTNNTETFTKLESSLLIKDKEIEDWKDKAYRLTADLQNLGRQHEIDLQQSSKRGKKSVVQLILPFVNTMNLSFAYVPESKDESLTLFVNTLKSSFDKLINDFSAAGIEFLVPQIGDEIDTTYMSVLNSADDQDDLTVQRVIGVGVRIDGQVIQEATVMV